jgi:hypothetical protein
MLNNHFLVQKPNFTLNLKLNLMKRNVVFSLLVVMCAILTFSSCKKQEYLVGVTGSVTGVARDYVTSQPLSGVTVSVVLSDKTVLKDSTDAQGYYTIVGVPVGKYDVTFSKSGYATMHDQIELNADQETTLGKKQSYQLGVTCDVIMPQMIGKLTGVVTFNGANANGATVVLAFNGNNTYYEPSLYTTSTSKDGVYSFTNVPLGMSITVTAYNSSASGSASVSGLSYGESVVPYSQDITLSASALTLVNYTGKGTSTAGIKLDTAVTSIKLTFSENVSADTTVAHGGRVYITVGGIAILTESPSYSGNTVTLTLKGNLSSNTTYDINYNVYATSHKSTSGTVSFTTKEKGAIITGTATLTRVSATEIDITGFPTVSGGVSLGTLATYDIYYKTKIGNDTEYRNITSDITQTPTPGLVTLKHTAGNFPLGFYYVVPKVTGFDGNTVYGAPSNMVPMN